MTTSGLVVNCVVTSILSGAGLSTAITSLVERARSRLDLNDAVRIYNDDLARGNLGIDAKRTEPPFQLSYSAAF